MKDLVGKWNYYFLRYAVGSIVGAYIVLQLIHNDILPIPFSVFHLYSLDFVTAITLLVLGFAYCYIASAPILLLHALRGLVSGDGDIRGFYTRLARDRARANVALNAPRNNVSEYVESYRDLREHSNAFFILLLEIILARALICFGGCAIFVLCIWISPGAISWFIATHLEFKIPNVDDQTRAIAGRLTVDGEINVT